MTYPSTYWNYRIIKLPRNDGMVYGLVEVHYNDGEISAWSAEPYWIEQKPEHFATTIDEYEAEYKRGVYPAWAAGLEEDMPAVFGMMRQATRLNVIDDPYEG